MPHSGKLWTNTKILGEAEKNCQLQTRESLQMGKDSTDDLLVLTSPDQLLVLLKYIFIVKQILPS
jgi:hypothetical protein